MPPSISTPAPTWLVAHVAKLIGNTDPAWQKQLEANPPTTGEELNAVLRTWAERDPKGLRTAIAEGSEFCDSGDEPAEAVAQEEAFLKLAAEALGRAGKR